MTLTEIAAKLRAEADYFCTDPTYHKHGNRLIELADALEVQQAVIENSACRLDDVSAALRRGTTTS